MQLLLPGGKGDRAKWLSKVIATIFSQPKAHVVFLTEPFLLYVLCTYSRMSSETRPFQTLLSTPWPCSTPSSSPGPSLATCWSSPRSWGRQRWGRWEEPLLSSSWQHHIRLTCSLSCIHVNELPPSLDPPRKEGQPATRVGLGGPPKRSSPRVWWCHRLNMGGYRWMVPLWWMEDEKEGTDISLWHAQGKRGKRMRFRPCFEPGSVNSLHFFLETFRYLWRGKQSYPNAPPRTFLFLGGGGVSPQFWQWFMVPLGAPYEMEAPTPPPIERQKTRV